MPFPDMTTMRRRKTHHLPAMLLALATSSGIAAATSIDGEAMYRERIAPPAERLTRARAAELALAANCPEGEAGCARPPR